MKLTVLVDNNTLIDRYFLGEPGLSLLLEDNDARVLFDLGYSDAFLINARKLGLNLLRLDHVVLSHGHLDHSWGLSHLIRLLTEAVIEGLDHTNPVLTAHPDALASKTLPAIPEIGSFFGPDKLKRHFNLQLSAEPIQLTEKITFLGQIQRHFDFEPSEPMGQTHAQTAPAPDHLKDDTALAYAAKDGLVVIAGCAHAGICNTIETARQITGQNKVIDVIGGFHLLNPTPERLTQTANYLASLNLKALHACHCTDLHSKIRLAASAPLQEVGVGLVLEYE